VHGRSGAAEFLGNVGVADALPVALRDEGVLLRADGELPTHASPRATLHTMDAGWAAVAGAAVGAVASIATATVGAIPGFSSEDRSHRLERAKRRDAAVIEIGEILVLESTDIDRAETEGIERRRRLLVLRFHLVTHLKRRDAPLIRLFDSVRRALDEDDRDLWTTASAAWGVAGPNWIAGIRNLEQVESLDEELRAGIKGRIWS
jgi:hypothetical protein